MPLNKPLADLVADIDLAQEDFDAIEGPANDRPPKRLMHGEFRFRTVARKANSWHSSMGNFRRL